MKKIGSEKLKFYRRYYGEYDLMFERGVDETDQNKISYEEFHSMTMLEDNLATLRSGLCSDELRNSLQNKIDLAREKMTDEVFEYLYSEKFVIKRKKWWERIFG